MPERESIVLVQELKKSFVMAGNAPKAALNRLRFQIWRGEIYKLLGPNGVFRKTLA
jgi:ABC-type multidrug transport system ATPase subunit